MKAFPARHTPPLRNRPCPSFAPPPWGCLVWHTCVCFFLPAGRPNPVPTQRGDAVEAPTTRNLAKLRLPVTSTRLPSRLWVLPGGEAPRYPPPPWRYSGTEPAKARAKASANPLFGAQQNQPSANPASSFLLSRLLPTIHRDFGFRPSLTEARGNRRLPVVCRLWA